MGSTFSQSPGDLTITHVAGDAVNFTIDLDLDVTGYTFSAGVYAASVAGFQGGGGGQVPDLGPTLFAPTISVVDAAAGTLTWGVTSTQTSPLSSGVAYRHFIKWVTPAGLPRTIVSGDYIVKAP